MLYSMKRYYRIPISIRVQPAEMEIRREVNRGQGNLFGFNDLGRTCAFGVSLMITATEFYRGVRDYEWM
jgi:hypothetical protein